MSERKRLSCNYCGYVWVTKSQMKLVTCPSCTRKVDSSAQLIKAQIADMQHFNVDEDGVRLLDNSIITKYSPFGRIIDVFFKRGKAYCDYCDSNDCKHVKFALILPIVLEILKKKGWKIKDG